MNRHTSRSWQYKRTDGFDYGGTAYRVPGICTNIKNEEDARLIAAAPDLLETLVEAANFIQPYSVGHELLERIDAAIAKATGGQA